MLVMEEPATPIAKTDKVGVPVLSLFLEEERNETDFVHSDCTIVAGWLGFPTNCIVAWLLLVSSGSRVSPPTMKMYSQ